MTNDLSTASFDPTGIERPAPALMSYYIVASLLTGPFFLLPLIPLWFKYRTLRYRFDDEGISMSWGVIFRRETVLTYRRIQDIHVTRNIVQRWMGLASVAIQTASGDANAEMSIEGILQADELRDYLYSRMRGAKGLNALQSSHVSASTEGQPATDEVLDLLRDIRDSLKTSRSPGGAQ